jgi:putative flippase GtrA
VTSWATGIRRFVRYNLVGALGLVVKFSVLTAMVELAGAGYLAATAVAVEAVILHNFAWHLRWTWRERCAGLSRRQTILRLLKFQLAAGAVAMVANLPVMWLLVNRLGIHYLPANVAATVVAGTANFLLAEFFVFLAPPQSRGIRLATVPPGPSCRT